MSLTAEYYKIRAKAMQDLANKAEGMMVLMAPYHTGALRKSINQTWEGGGSVFVGPHVRAKSNGFDYAQAAEHGRGAIYAKNAPYLVFQTYDGRWHRVKKAKGYKGSHFAKKTAKYIRSRTNSTK